MAKKKTTIKKKVQKEVSNNELSKQIKLIGERLETVNTNLSSRIQDVSEQVEVTAMAVANVQNRLAEINAKMIGMNQKINGLNNRFDDLASNHATHDEVHILSLRVGKLENKTGLAKK